MEYIWAGRGKEGTCLKGEWRLWIGSLVSITKQLAIELATKISRKHSTNKKKYCFHLSGLHLGVSHNKIPLLSKAKLPFRQPLCWVEEEPSSSQRSFWAQRGHSSIYLGLWMLQEVVMWHLLVSSWDIQKFHAVSMCVHVGRGPGDGLTSRHIMGNFRCEVVEFFSVSEEFSLKVEHVQYKTLRTNQASICEVRDKFISPTHCGDSSLSHITALLWSSHSSWSCYFFQVHNSFIATSWLAVGCLKRDSH